MLGSGGSIGSCLLHPGQFFGVDRFGEDLHWRLLQRAVPDVAVLLAENAAAVLLHIQLCLPGLFLSLLESHTEIPVEELNTILFCQPFADLPDQFMLLIGAHQQGGGKLSYPLAAA